MGKTNLELKMKIIDLKSLINEIAYNEFDWSCDCASCKKIKSKIGKELIGK